MADRIINGITGVLGELISSAPSSGELPSCEQPSGANQKPKPVKSPEATSIPSRRARLGRPLGVSNRGARPKEKVTLHVPSVLISEYRDWSWEARCSLSALVEKAMVDFFRKK